MRLWWRGCLLLGHAAISSILKNAPCIADLHIREGSRLKDAKSRTSHSCHRRLFVTWPYIWLHCCRRLNVLVKVVGGRVTILAQWISIVFSHDACHCLVFSVLMLSVVLHETSHSLCTWFTNVIVTQRLVWIYTSTILVIFLFISRLGPCWCRNMLSLLNRLVHYSDSTLRLDLLAWLDLMIF